MGLALSPSVAVVCQSHIQTFITDNIGILSSPFPTHSPPPHLFVEDDLTVCMIALDWGLHSIQRSHRYKNISVPRHVRSLPLRKRIPNYFNDQTLGSSHNKQNTVLILCLRVIERLIINKHAMHDDSKPSCNCNLCL